MQAQHVPDLPTMFGVTGFRTAFGGIVLPPGAKVASYVRSTGVQSGDPQDIKDTLRTTLNEGLKLCRSGMGDYVIVLPGHSESVTSATALSNLVAGTRIVGGAGPGGAGMPSFRWTAVAAQWALSKDNVHIEGLRLRLEGADSVTKAINVTGADNTIVGCDIEHASSATTDTAISLEVGTGAHRFKFLRNYNRGTANGTTVDALLIAGDVNDVMIADNTWMMTMAANGHIRATGACVGLNIVRNNIMNLHATAGVNITLNNAALVAFIAYNNIGFTNGTITGAITVTAGSAYRFQNSILGAIAASGSMVIPAADT